MVIAPPTTPVSKCYRGKKAGEVINNHMLGKYMKSLTSKECPVVLSITDTVAEKKSETVIHRNRLREVKLETSNDIYTRARGIYYRARRHRPVRAASIF